MKDANMKVHVAMKRLFEKGKRRCACCHKKFNKKDTFCVVPNEAKNKNFIVDGEMLCKKCFKYARKSMKGRLNADDLLRIRYALGEVLDFFRKDKKHKKEHENSKCHRCVDYKALQKKISRYVPD